ncbi:MAG: hypothetical protein KBG80_07175 [Breznakibacter sp.]|nr:hypothetical protein [Breznakibacter sp.]
MKTKILSILFLFALALFSNAQDFSQLNSYLLVDGADYGKAEPKVKECVNYILSVPIDDQSANRTDALQFIIRWMVGTPDFSFGIGQSAANISKNDTNLMGLYMVCITKVGLEHREIAKDNGQMDYETIMTLLPYCEKESNNVKLNKELKKMIKQRNAGTLKEYLAAYWK